MKACLVAIALLLGVGGRAAAEEAVDEHRLGLGLAVGTPGGGSGIPVELMGGPAGMHLGAALTGRYRLGPSLAIDAGLGTPVAGDGARIWGGVELAHTLVASAGGGVRWWIYAAPGAELGFVGPGYYARHEQVFVGWEYIYSGPLTAGLRLPVGTAVTLLHERMDVFGEALPVLGFWPGPDLVVAGQFGVRFYL
jgi:hypothetical protein